MKISIISHSYSALENRKNLEALSQCADIEVICPDRIPGTSKFVANASASNAFTLRLYKSFEPFSCKFILWTVNFHWHSFKPQIIYIEYDPWSPIFIQAYIAKFFFARHSKIICMVKKNTYIKKKIPLIGPLIHFIMSYLTKKVHHYFAASRLVANIYRTEFGIPSRQISVVTHLGVDEILFKPSLDKKNQIFANLRRTESDCIVGFCGKFETRKGIPEILDSIRWLNKMRPGIRFTLLGHGQMLEQIRNQSLDNLDILDEVTHAEVASFMRFIDIFVFPSRCLPDHEEHDAHALLEALSCGIPSIGSRSGIIPEILNNESGVLIKPESSDELSSAILSLVNDPYRRAKYGEVGRQKVLSEYSIKTVAKKKQQLFERCLNE